MKSILFLFFLFSAFALHAQTDTSRISNVDSAVYFKPEIEAMYPGGLSSWARYLTKNLMYPDEARKKNIQGTVVAKFMVDSYGIAHDVTIVSGPEELRNETITLIYRVKIWAPAVNQGKKVNSCKILPIVFKLAD